MRMAEDFLEYETQLQAMEFWSLEYVKYQKQLELNPGSHRGAWLQDSTYLLV